MMKQSLVPLLPALLVNVACSALFPPDLPEEPPPLVDMEEPLDLFEEPKDERARKALPYGTFTGVEVVPAWRSLDEAEEENPGVRVKTIVEHSPGDIAGLTENDLLLEARDEAGRVKALAWTSQWRELELNARPGDEITVVYDRAGVEMEAKIRVIPRVRPSGRQPVERFREEGRIGVVLRTATEVEAQSSGLGPGGGAVIVGLTRNSPWRKAGLRYGDLVVAVNGKSVAHPQVVLDAIREAEESLDVRFIRGGEPHEVETAVSTRESELTRFTIPLIFEYEKDRDEKEISILFGIILHRTTAAAWEWRLLWLFRLRGGDADRLEEVDNP